MSRRIFVFLTCVTVIGLVVIGWRQDRFAVNEIPQGEQLEQYNQAITEIESAEEKEN